MDLIYNYILDGAIGGCLYVLVSKLGYDHRYDIIRRVGIGAISGLIVFYSGLPDHLSAIGLGYIGIDAIEAILIKKELIKPPKYIISNDKII